jgi:hypothetical protein
MDLLVNELAASAPWLTEELSFKVKFEKYHLVILSNGIVSIRSVRDRGLLLVDVAPTKERDEYIPLPVVYEALTGRRNIGSPRPPPIAEVREMLPVVANAFADNWPDAKRRISDLVAKRKRLLEAMGARKPAN